MFQTLFTFVKSMCGPQPQGKKVFWKNIFLWVWYFSRQTGRSFVQKRLPCGEVHMSLAKNLHNTLYNNTTILDQNHGAGGELGENSTLAKTGYWPFMDKFAMFDGWYFGLTNFIQVPVKTTFLFTTFASSIVLYHWSSSLKVLIFARNNFHRTYFWENIFPRFEFS